MKRIRVKRKRKKSIFLLLIFIVLFGLLLSYFYVFYSIPSLIELNVGSDLKEKYTFKVLLFNVNLNKKLSKVDTNKLGVYDSKYVYRFLFIKVNKKININVVDKESPVFVSFDDKVEVYLDEKYDENDYKCEVKDNYDDVKNINVGYRGKIDTSKVGEYYLVYYAIDSSNNKTEKVRKVSVNRKSPLTLSTDKFDLTDYFSDIILKDTGDMGNEYMNQVYFAGDSVFWNFTKFGIYDSSKVWAKPCTDPANIYTQKVEVNNIQSSYTIPQLIDKNKPKYVILNIGGCQSQGDNVDSFIKSYKDFLVDMKKNQSNTKIIVQTFNPVIEKSYTPYINNAGRNKFNYYIAKMCKELDIPLLDISNMLKDKNGSCRYDLCMDDGYHPNIKGMNMIVNYVRTHGYEE